MIEEQRQEETTSLIPMNVEGAAISTSNTEDDDKNAKKLALSAKKLALSRLVNVILAVMLVFLVVGLRGRSKEPEKELENSSIHTFPAHAMRDDDTTLRFPGATHDGYFKVTESDDTNLFRFAAVSDLEQNSREQVTRKPKFRSILLPGILRKELNRSTNKILYTIEFEETRELFSKLNEAGRGMELSELTLYKNHLLAFDDYSGTVFEILNKHQGKESYVVPRIVITAGDGYLEKGMFISWATVKDDQLYVGSVGKEYTTPDGSVVDDNHIWVPVWSSHSGLRREHWVNEYMVVRKALGAASPGYCLHEAVLWSNHLQKWIFAPHRVSSDAYDEVEDEHKGSNKIVLVNQDFTDVTVVQVQVQNVDPLHGFSTMAFIPGSEDRHVLAVRTVEQGDCTDKWEAICKRRSYFMVFDVLTGEVLLDETKYPGEDVKFEGVEFADIHTPEYYV